MQTPGRFLRVLLVLALLTSLSTLAACESSTTARDPYEKPVTVARTEVWRNITSGKTASCSVAILDGGAIVYSEGFGMADREESTPVSASIIFNLGSISKTFCATAVMVLVDDGKVELDAPVVRYLPRFKMADPRYKDITVRMLLNHTSGLPGSSYVNNFGYARNTYYEDTLANLSTSHLKAAPGATGTYCNDGWTLAEMMVSKVSGKPYIDFLSERVFEPLGLDRTGASTGERVLEGKINVSEIARFYDPEKTPPEVASLLAAGGLSSTPENLCLFADSFSTGGKAILDKATVAEMIKPQPSEFAKTAVRETGKNPERAYGLGFDWVDLPEYKEKGIKVIGKDGDTFECHSAIISVPEKRLSVAVSETGHGEMATPLALDVLRSLLESKGLVDEKKPDVGPPPAPQAIPTTYADFAGWYTGSNATWTLSFDFNANTARLATMSGDQEMSQAVLTYRDGLFYKEDGHTYYLISVGGRKYLVKSQLGGIYQTDGEKVSPVAEPQALEQDMNGRFWIRRNTKPFEHNAYFKTHMIPTYLPAALPGYVDAIGLQRIESPTFAGMISNDVRDEYELWLVRKDGEDWLRLSDALYSPIEDAQTLAKGDKAVTIGKGGYSEWLTAGENVIVAFKKPSRARAVVFSPDFMPVWDSVLDTGKVYVPAGSFIELAGMPGDVLTVVATAPAIR